MANDPQLLLEPNPRGGLLPPAPTTPKPKKKKALLPLRKSPKEPAMEKEPSMTHSNMGSSQSHMGSSQSHMGSKDPHAGHMMLDPAPTTRAPFSLAGSEVLKEWLPSNFNDRFPGLDAKSMPASDPASPSKSVNQIFNSNLGSVQVPGSGRGSEPQGMKNNVRPIVDSQLPVTDTRRMGQMANAGELFLDSFSSVPEFGNAIDLKSTADRGGKILDIATGIVQDQDPNAMRMRGVEKEYSFFYETNCRTRAHYTSTGKMDDAVYEENLNGDWVVRLCAPGSGYNATTCGCTNMKPGKKTTRYLRNLP
jgi:hypothetical protein